MAPLVDCLEHLVEDHHVVVILDFLMRSVVAPIHLEVPLFLESVLFLMVVHMDFPWVHQPAQIPLFLESLLLQIPLFLESLLLLHHRLIPQSGQSHSRCIVVYQKLIFHSFVEPVDP